MIIFLPMCHFNGDICHLTGIFGLGLCCQLFTEGYEYRSGYRDQVPEIECKEWGLKHIRLWISCLWAFYNESFIYTPFTHAGQSMTQSELSIRLKICMQSWKLNNTPTLFSYTIMIERDSRTNVRFDCPISAFLVNSQATGSPQYILYNAKPSL